MLSINITSIRCFFHLCFNVYRFILHSSFCAGISDVILVSDFYVQNVFMYLVYEVLDT